MTITTTRNCFNDKYMIHKGSEVEIVREFMLQGEEALVFKEVNSLTNDTEHEEFRCMKAGTFLHYDTTPLKEEV